MSNLNEYAGKSSKTMGEVPKKIIFSDVIAPKKEIISLIEQATRADIFPSENSDIATTYMKIVGPPF